MRIIVFSLFFIISLRAMDILPEKISEESTKAWTQALVYCAILSPWDCEWSKARDELDKVIDIEGWGSQRGIEAYLFAKHASIYMLEDRELPDELKKFIEDRGSDKHRDLLKDIEKRARAAKILIMTGLPKEQLLKEAREAK